MLTSPCTYISDTHFHSLMGMLKSMQFFRIETKTDIFFVGASLFCFCIVALCDSAYNTRLVQVYLDMNSPLPELQETRKLSL